MRFIIGATRNGMSTGKPVDWEGLRNLEIGRKSPTMQNGQLPGVKRRYNTAYAMLLQEIVGRWGSAL